MQQIFSKALTSFIPKSDSLILYPHHKVQNLPLLPTSNLFQKESAYSFRKCITSIISILSLGFTLMMMKDDSNDEIEFVIPEVFIENIDMANILKDKKFYDYLLQSLTDHYGKLSGWENVTMRSEFTKEFFARYWECLMKIADIDQAPPLNLEEHEHHGKTNNGFDSIFRSLFGVCESRIDLRITKKFVFDGKDLDDEEQIHRRTEFMLILLFVSMCFADQKDECPFVALKEPKSRLVHACFSKLFKDIYDGDDEDFKNYIFDDNKDHYPASPPPFFSSPNGSLNNFDLSLLEGTPAKSISVETEQETSIDRLSQTNDALLKAVNLKTRSEEELVAEYKRLETMANEKAAELEKANKPVSDLLEKQQNAEKSFSQTQNELQDLIGRHEEIKKENQSLFDLNVQLQHKYDTTMDQLATFKLENDRLSEENEDLMTNVSNYAQNEKRLEEENQTLKEALDAKIMELENNNGDIYRNFAEEKRTLEFDLSKTQLELSASNNLVLQREEELKNLLNTNQSLDDTVEKLQKERDSFVEELFAVKLEAREIKESNESLIAEKETFQQKLGEKVIELEDLCKLRRMQESFE
uniref:Uncharacterized protein n=1 Tax=Panagrolaimus davidi TaxID=227884 RepID=A0A914P7R2_9BILA